MKMEKILENDYSNIYKINVISSADLVNWTDHGSVYALRKMGQQLGEIIPGHRQQPVKKLMEK